MAFLRSSLGGDHAECSGSAAGCLASGADPEDEAGSSPSLIHTRSEQLLRPTPEPTSVASPGPHPQRQGDDRIQTPTGQPA